MANLRREIYLQQYDSGLLKEECILELLIASTKLDLQFSIDLLH